MKSLSIFNIMLAGVSVLMAGGLSACSEDAETINFFGEQEMTLSVSVPDGIRARSGNYYGDGTGSFYLQYAIEGPDGRVRYSSADAASPAPEEAAPGSWTIKARLMSGEDYKILLWADQYNNSDESPYSVNLSSGTLSVNYAKGAGEDMDDAFYAYKEFKAGQTTSFTMKRPFCQVIIGSNEDFIKENSVSACVGMGGADGAGGSIYQSLNLKTGQPSQPTGFNISDNWRSSSAFTSKDFYGDEEAGYITMRYVIPAANTSKITFGLQSPDEGSAYTVDLGSTIKPNTRIVISPEKAFFDKQSAVRFNIRYDDTFDNFCHYNGGKFYIVNGAIPETRRVLAGHFAADSKKEDWNIYFNGEKIELPVDPETKDFLYVFPSSFSGKITTAWDAPGSEKLEAIYHFPCLSDVTDGSRLFEYYAGYVLDLNGINTSNITKMVCMFADAWHFNKLDLSTFKTMQVNSMRQMFMHVPIEHLILGKDFIISEGCDYTWMFESASIKLLTCTAEFRDWLIAHQSEVGLPTLPTFDIIP